MSPRASRHETPRDVSALHGGEARPEQPRATQHISICRSCHRRRSTRIGTARLVTLLLRNWNGNVLAFLRLSLTGGTTSTPTRPDRPHHQTIPFDPGAPAGIEG